MTHRSSVFRFVSAVCCGTLIALPLQDGYVSLAAPDACDDARQQPPRDSGRRECRTARSLVSAIVEAQLGRDPARTFAWVRDHTYWIPNHGILRGAVGVLMDRQGDSLDRALLLATMLKDEAQTVRLAHGIDLRAAQAQALMFRLLSVPRARVRREGEARVNHRNWPWPGRSAARGTRLDPWPACCTRCRRRPRPSQRTAKMPR